MSDRDFLPLGQDILVSHPKVDTGADDDPNIIIVCGWMGAKFSHLQKYLKVYSERYPGATILLVRCFHNIVWTTGSAMLKKLLPLIIYLQQTGCISFKGGVPPLLKTADIPAQKALQQPRIIVHTFSNGGTFHLRALSNALTTLGAVPNPHVSAMVIDSSPGGNYFTTLRAFSGFVQNPLLRSLAAAFISIVYLLLYMKGTLFGVRSPIQQVSDMLIRADILPWTGTHTPRLYVFSKADELVPWEEVHDTARRSELAGLDTRIELFDESPHVAHGRTDPARYWSAIRKAWETACSVTIQA
ncbi:hypothetical protein ONZ45_g2481 [Pleurotus djamor]|nr:hypothetical protein ONZ45_g2481 [Pleurotus djamor]